MLANFLKIWRPLGVRLKIGWIETEVVLINLLLISIAMPSFADSSISPSDECHRAARFAAHETGVPLNVLLAIARVETGRSIDGKTQPWPWAINAKGKGRWLESEAELLEAALALIADGERRFDLGCFQLNYHWHSAEFSSLDEMISPRANALYAAQFLLSLFSEHGDWINAAGAYHSRTETLSKIYKAKFTKHYDQVTESPRVTAQLKHPRQKKRINSYPLLRSSLIDARLGSLVPGVSQ